MHFDKGANVLHLFSVGGHMSSYVNCLGGGGADVLICHFLMGGTCPGGGGNVLHSV